MISVGKLKEKPYRLMADEYLKRLSRFGKYEEIELPDLPERDGASQAEERQIKTREGEAMLQRIRPGDRVIALTIPGKQGPARSWRRRWRRRRTGGPGGWCF